ncbi:MAG: formylglycine-generating enzyme family protein [bacterium]
MKSTAYIRSECRPDRHPATIGRRQVHLRFLVSCLFFLVAQPEGIAAPPFALLSTLAAVSESPPELIAVYEFDKPSLADVGWWMLNGGFAQTSPGEISTLEDVSSSIPSSADRLGVRISVESGQVMLLYKIQPIETGGSPLLFRATLRATSPRASIALAVLKGNLITSEELDFSIATHIPATAQSFVQEERRLTLLYEPDTGEIVTPILQVASIQGPEETGTVHVFLDKFEVFAVDPVIFGSKPGTTTPVPIETETPELTPTPIPADTPTPAANPPGEVITINLAGLEKGEKPLELVEIPRESGRFTMGEDDDGDSDERPEHDVSFAFPFYMSRYEITQAQWSAVTGLKNPSLFRRPDNPVERITWFQSARFCNRLSEKDGRSPAYDETTWAVNFGSDGFRLPTEAEWESACRAGTNTAFSFGDAEGCDYSSSALCDEIDPYAWYSANSGSRPQSVGSKLPNLWSLFDMHGNVAEWCNDWYGSYPSSQQISPVGPESGSYRVVRGGSYETFPSGIRSAKRSKYFPNQSWPSIGFRIVTWHSTPVPTPTPTATRPPTPTPFPMIVAPIPNLPDGAKGLELVEVPGGRVFSMGAPDGEYGRQPNESPQHNVRMLQPFYVGKYEVTNAQFASFLNAKGNESSEGREYFSDSPNDGIFKYSPDPWTAAGATMNHPVVNVSWYGARDFCLWINEVTGSMLPQSPFAGLTFHLPSEAQWEYACRAGTTTAYWGGSNSPWGWYEGDSDGECHGVGMKQANPWGLFDTHGNAAEWCEDDYHDSYVGAPGAGGAWIDSPRSVLRVVRGGHFNADIIRIRSASRGYLAAQATAETHGFRVFTKID